MGEIVGTTEGTSLGDCDGIVVGRSEGTIVGGYDGNVVGKPEGTIEGISLGIWLGLVVG